MEEEEGEESFGEVFGGQVVSLGSAIEVRYSHPLVSAWVGRVGDWFQDACRYPNPWMLKSLI